MPKVICKRGDKGVKVKEIQEWLCLHGLRIAIDGDFGPATEAAVKEFGESGGIVMSDIWDRLTYPLTQALRPVSPRDTLGEAVVAVARQHLKYHPREVGGQNRGPWVRLYCRGRDGSPWAWCAGFVSHVIAQAAKSQGVEPPLAYTLSCDRLAALALKKEIFLVEGREWPWVGDIFLNRKTPGDWVHTGIVTKVFAEHFHTIEGNTNDDGSREGYEVCARRRGYKNRDFVALSLLED